MLKNIDIRSIHDNPFALIGDQWTLITAGDQNVYNTMTASWGGLGVLWSRPVATVYVRPQRYTYGFMEKNDYFTLTFFAPGERREALNLCGSKSGRDMDKFAASGLTAAFAACGAPYVAEGELVLVCRKLFAQDLEAESFLDRTIIDKNYPGGDFHRMYVLSLIHI